MKQCKNCNDFVTDDGYGNTIHTNGKFCCKSGMPKKDSVAELNRLIVTTSYPK